MNCTIGKLRGEKRPRGAHIAHEFPEMERIVGMEMRKEFMSDISCRSADSKNLHESWSRRGVDKARQYATGRGAEYPPSEDSLVNCLGTDGFTWE